ncbi:UTRA domain-containing protein [Alkalicoccus luteus]|uniref:UTRA domain-containing protein n=1 Tax=Alkalicoccus luteus TaxID=1237094 RepID=A0A969PM16_9BACI|nr:UTRA domain-containing protein [Alkalicoccus luteus]NJP36680.1 UTRA domain-containing protein [Alkalicoccus luteus]
MRGTSPLYKQIAARMKEEITKGIWKQGNAIPTEAKLSERFSASRVTIRQAIKQLVQEELLYKVQGSGTYVTENKFEHNIYALQGFTEEMEALNKTTCNKVLQFSVIEPDNRIRQILGLEEGEQVYYIRRQRWVDDKPLVVEDTYMPLSLFPDLSYETMKGSKYAYVEQVKKLRIKESFQEVIPILPDQSIRELLLMKEDIPIIKVHLFSRLYDETVFEYTEIYFKSDEYKFTIMAGRS